MANDRGLKDDGVKLKKATKYKNLMKDTSTFTTIVSKGMGKERFGRSPLLLEHMLLAYVIVWIITPRGAIMHN